MKCVLVCRTLTSVFLVVVSRYTKQSDRDQVAVDGVYIKSGIRSALFKRERHAFNIGRQDYDTA